MLLGICMQKSLIENMLYNKVYVLKIDKCLIKACIELFEKSNRIYATIHICS